MVFHHYQNKEDGDFDVEINVDDNCVDLIYSNVDVCIDFYLQIAEYVFLNLDGYHPFFYISPPLGISGASVADPSISGSI